MSTAPIPIAQSPQKRWIAYGQSLNHGKTQKVFICSENAPLTWHQVIERWQQEADFRRFITQILKDSAYSAFFWETPPLTLNSLHHPWEFALVDAPLLSKVVPNPQPFATYLQKNHSPIVVFPNLGGDAMLIVPSALGAWPAYTHFANFVRQAPTEQIDALWQVLGASLDNTINHLSSRTSPLWVSTSGLGVYWLHIRLDDYPKYFTYTPYRSAV
ncbi:hypothetical protein [Acaryochloris sp. IP29b_bin.137]|uniref:DUF6940 family protein n=1 Tax=Acaryochloris sp. IP29b_bin.137 TaxID=2969217 RepID=UPI002626413F|nr:hypothetical protein [Acaryochloris sp. IP29b_bin.137]